MEKTTFSDDISLYILMFVFLHWTLSSVTVCCIGLFVCIQLSIVILWLQATVNG